MTVSNIVISDRALKRVLEENVGEGLTAEKLATITELNANHRGIESLGGLEYSTSLRIARFAGNQIMNVFPLVSLGNLSELDLSHNQKTKYRETGRYEEAFSEVDKQRDADVMGAAVNARWPVSEPYTVYFGTDAYSEDMVFLSKLVHLTRLELADNGISTMIPFLMLHKIRYLDLRNNKIEDIGPLLFHPGLGGLTVDLRGNPFAQKPRMDLLHILHRLRDKQAEIQYEV